MDIFLDATRAATRAGHYEQVREYLWEYRRLSRELADIDLPQGIALENVGFDRICSDLTELLRVTLPASESTSNSIVNSQHLIAAGLQTKDLQTFDTCHSTLCNFIDETYRLDSENSVRENIVERICELLGQQSGTGLSSDLTTTDFQQLNLLIRRSRRIGILLARRGEFEVLDELFQRYNSIYTELDRRAGRDNGTVELAGREVFTSDPLDPDFDSDDIPDLTILFRDAVDAIRFEIALAAYTAFLDESITTPNNWTESSGVSSFTEDPGSLTEAYDRWKRSQRGAKTTIELGNVTGTAMDTLNEWNLERDKLVAETYSGLLLFHTETSDQQQRPEDLEPPNGYAEFYETSSELVSEGRASTLGQQITWDTLDATLDLFAEGEPLTNLETVGDLTMPVKEALLRSFQQAARDRFTLRQWFVDHGQLNYRQRPAKKTLVNCRWEVDPDEIYYSEEGVPGLIFGNRISELRDNIVTGWISQLRGTDSLTERKVTSQTAINSEIRQMIRECQGDVVAIRQPAGLPLESEEQGLSGLMHPPESSTSVVECYNESATLPVFEHDLDYDLVLLPTNSLSVVEPERLEDIPSVELDESSNALGVEVEYRAHIRVDSRDAVAFSINESTEESI